MSTKDKNRNLGSKMVEDHAVQYNTTACVEFMVEGEEYVDKSWPFVTR
jgi:hypothetical protein